MIAIMMIIMMLMSYKMITLIMMTSVIIGMTNNDYNDIK